MRLAGDRRATVAPRVLDTMRLMARSDPSPGVFSQLAATAQRLRPEQGWPLLTALTLRRDFEDDPQIPAQIWWAWEAQLSQRPEDAVAALQTHGLWERRLFREAVAGRLARRLAAERSPATLQVLGDCLRTAPTRGARELFLEGMAEGFEGVAADVAPPDEFLRAFDAALATVDPSLALVRAGLRLRVPAAVGIARRTVRDPAARDEDRALLLTALAEAGESPEPDWLLEVVAGRDAEAVRMAAARVLAGGLGESALRGLWPRLPGWPEALRETFLLALAGRRAGAQALVTAVEAGTLPRELVPVSVVQALRSWPDAGVAAAVERLWGRPRQPEASRIRRAAEVRAALAAGPGDAARGEALFRERCAACHRLRGLGAAVGPDLTGYDRSDVEFLVTATVDPSLAVREEYLLTTLHLRGPAGAVSGFIEGGDAARLRVRNLSGEVVEVPLADVLHEERSALSAMPEGLLDDLGDDDVRALFAFLKK